MARIPDELVEQVRDSADLVGIIQETVDLKRQGSDWRGPCPFHHGQGRNFAVIPRKGIYHCFVCHATGDAFTWYRERFGMDYPGAVREVARRVGIVIPEQVESHGSDPREPLFQAVDAACGWYAGQLCDSPGAERARRYLQQRNFDLAAAAELQLGYAGEGRDFLVGMRQLGISDALLLEAGLARQREDGSCFAYFRDRLLFPLHDLRGRVVGFGGRALGNAVPKYLNTAETPLFHKGEQLYNLYQARQAIRRNGYGILTEGYFDVQRLVLTGTTGVVAAMGTGLTETQALLLKRYAPEVILLYDSDAAGLKATFRAGDMLLRHGLRVRVATMPEGDDPDTLVLREGGEAIQKLLHDAADLLERKLQLLELHGWFRDAGRSREALDRLLPTLRAATEPMTRELYISRVADQLRIPREVIAGEVASHPAPPVAKSPEKPSPQRTPDIQASLRNTRTAKVERLLLRIILTLPGWLARARDEVAPDDFTVDSYRNIFSALAAIADDAPISDAFLALDPISQEVWNAIVDNPLDDAFSADRDYAGALDMFAENRLFPEIEAEPDPTLRRRRWQALTPEAQVRYKSYLLARSAAARPSNNRPPRE